MGYCLVGLRSKESQFFAGHRAVGLLNTHSLVEDSVYKT